MRRNSEVIHEQLLFNGLVSHHEGIYHGIIQRGRTILCDCNRRSIFLEKLGIFSFSYRSLVHSFKRNDEFMIELHIEQRRDENDHS